MTHDFFEINLPLKCIDQGSSISFYHGPNFENNTKQRVTDHNVCSAIAFLMLLSFNKQKNLDFYASQLNFVCARCSSLNQSIALMLRLYFVIAIFEHLAGQTFFSCGLDVARLLRNPGID